MYPELLRKTTPFKLASAKLALLKKLAPVDTPLFCSKRKKMEFCSNTYSLPVFYVINLQRDIQALKKIAAKLLQDAENYLSLQ